MRIIVLVIVLWGLVIIPPNRRLMSIDDDDDYFAVATAIAYGKFPYFSNEYHVGGQMPFASVGPGVLASPFVLAFSTVDHLAKAPITVKRLKDNRYWTWTLLGFQFAVYFYLLLGAVILYKALKLWATSFASSITTLAVIAGGGGLLVYAFWRPVMSHVFEFFTVSSAVLLISLALKGRRIAFHCELIGICASMIFLTRYNNIFLAGGVIILFFWIMHWKKKGSIDARSLFGVSLSFVMPILIFRVLPVLANGYVSSDQTYRDALSRIVPVFDPLFYWNRFGEIIFAPDMGLMYTAPVLLLAAWALYRHWESLPREVLVLAGFSLFDLYIAIIWRSFGAYYGYRYLVFTALPLLAIYLVIYVQAMERKFGKCVVATGLIVVCFFPFLSVFVFEKFARYSPILMIIHGFNTYSQPNYHLDLLSDMVHRPIETIYDAVQNAWKPGFIGMAREQVAQRVILYIGPPILFLLCYLVVVLFDRRSRQGKVFLPRDESSELGVPRA